ncbi:hypothetical protein ACLOJK_023244, partial [Asimina triloba]
IKAADEPCFAATRDRWNVHHLLGFAQHATGGTSIISRYMRKLLTRLRHTTNTWTNDDKDATR